MLEIIDQRDALLERKVFKRRLVVRVRLLVE